MHGTVPTVFYLVLLALIDASQIPRKNRRKVLSPALIPGIFTYLAYVYVKKKLKINFPTASLHGG